MRSSAYAEEEANKSTPLAEVLAEIATGLGEKLSAKRLGKFLTAHKGRWTSGYQIIVAMKRSGVNHWKVTKVGGDVVGLGSVVSSDNPTRRNCQADNCIERTETESPKPANPPGNSGIAEDDHLGRALADMFGAELEAQELRDD